MFIILFSVEGQTFEKKLYLQNVLNELFLNPCKYKNL